MTSPDRARYLHVANGTCTTRLIEAAGIPGACSIWADPLYEGPVPGDLDDNELLEVRRRFLTGPGEAPDPLHDLRQWRDVIARHGAYDELILWFEHDLFDQLNLIQLLTWIRPRLPGTLPVSLICVGSFPGRRHFKGLGELTPEELASLLDGRQRVGPAQYELAARAWDAFRAATPEPLDALRDADTSALPFLAPAIGRLLEEYPWTRDGLSRTERRLLELARNGGIALAEALPRMHDGERAYYITDVSLAGMVRALASTTPPLLAIDRSTADTGRILSGVATLTDAGRAVLSGTLDRRAVGDIDKWLGGVHLQRDARAWRWDESARRMTEVARRTGG